jgi:hypothetical protein
MQGASLGLLSGHCSMFSASVCCLLLDGPTILTQDNTRSHVRVHSYVTSGCGTSGCDADGMWLR